ncbi:MAG: hypothetical protein RLZZ543_215 [Bacteroidota bacterium]|jgi:beta-lactam-binding protein with PASTA domain
MDFTSFIKSPTFWRHLVVASVSAFLVLWGSFALLNVYTKHGDEVEVPNFEGIYIKDLDKFVEGHNVRYEIVDSIYNLDQAKGTVADQDPEPGSKVKPDRVIYLTVNAMLNQKVAMPNLVDLSLRQASSLLETYGLKVGVLRYVEGLPPVMKQLYKGAPIKAGTFIDKGSSIDLVLGRGNGGGLIPVPDVIGMTLSDARLYLTERQLVLGRIVPDIMDNDTINARVYRQNPSFDSEDGLYDGAQIDVWITNSEEKIEQARIKSDSLE